MAHNKQLIAGFTILLLGVFLYLHDRRPDQVFFIYTFRLPSLYNPEHSKIFGELGSNLPSFLHVCSFSLLTCALLPQQSKKKYVIACTSWSGVNILFEIGQLIATSALLNIPHWFTWNKIGINFFSYLQYGTFDFIDIIFAMFGGISAYCILVTLKGKDNEFEATKYN